MDAVENATAPWYAAYPAPSSTEVESISRDEVLRMMESGRTPGKDFVLIDLRRTDHEGRTIRGSINLPAQSLYPSIPSLYNLFKSAGIVQVIWYCSSSRGRGPRAAAWFRDHLHANEDGQMRSLVLEGGFKGWAAAGGEFAQWLDEPDSLLQGNR
ncbi:arsenate reductase [Xylariales sp. PMI_506]|nr:arsenate reductase [Xylariales sp. PMI_506]